MRPKWFARLSPTARAMCAAEGSLYIFLLAVGLTVIWTIYGFEKPSAFAIGLSMGCALSFAKIVLLDKTLAHAVTLGNQAKNYASLQAILRYFGTIAALAPALIFRDIIGVFGVIAGLLSLQLSAFIASAAITKRKRAEIKEPEDGGHVEDSQDDGGRADDSQEDGGAYAEDIKELKDLWD